MKYKAVIFDLFGTLVDSFTIRAHEDVLREMAEILSVPADDLIRVWFDTFSYRALGSFKSVEENVVHVCRELGVPVDDEKVKLAARIRFGFTISTLVPRPDSVKVISQLREAGLKIGLISDCSIEIPIIWPDTPFANLFDATLFSCSVGFQKPDLRIYQLATEQLAVEPEDCLYIGDGSSQELTGAAAVGMHPVLIRDPGEIGREMHRINFEGESWPGPVITSLKEVINLVE